METRYIDKYRNATRPKSFIIKLLLEGTEGRHGFPTTEVCVNDISYWKDTVENKQTISIQVDDLTIDQELSIELLDKEKDDTVVEDDQIVKDKTLKLHKIYIDEVDIKNYIYKGKQIPIYHHEGQGPKEVIGYQLFFPGKWKLPYQNPPRQFFASYSSHEQLINSPEKTKIKNEWLDNLKKITA